MDDSVSADGTEVLEPDLAQRNRYARGLKPHHPLCLAPSTSIYFRHDGKILACCRNHKQPYGRYPENSLEEVWRGIGRKMLAEAFFRDQFPSGCADCVENVRSENHRGMLATRFDELLKAPRNAMPITAEFELGTVCNLECIMCSGSCSSSIRKNREKLPPIKSPYDDAFIEQLKPFIPAFKQVHFLGGEPFLNRLNFKVFDLLIEHNPECEVSVTTNGSVLNDKVKRMIKALRPRIAVSMESLVPETYEAIRVNSSLTRIRAHLEWLYENGALDSISVCPLRRNWQDIPEIVSYCNSLGIPVWFNTVVEPAHLSLKFSPREELEEVVRFLSCAKIPDGYAPKGRGDWVNGLNASRFRDLVNLMTAWRDAAHFSGSKDLRSSADKTADAMTL